MTKTKGLALLIALALTAAACGGDSSDGDNGGGDGGTSIEVSGSSTVEPITALVAEDFSAANPDVAISVEGPGTGDGFARFCNGETDISDASRAIKFAGRRGTKISNLCSAGVSAPHEAR